MRPSSLAILKVGAVILEEQGFLNCRVIQNVLTSPGHADDPHLLFRGRISALGEVADASIEPVGPSAQMLVANGSSQRRHREFSPIEEAIMRAVTDQWQTKAQISILTGYPITSTLSVLLSNLVERGYLESSGRGYRLAAD